MAAKARTVTHPLRWVPRSKRVHVDLTPQDADLVRHFLNAALRTEYGRLEERLRVAQLTRLFRTEAP